MEEKQLRQRLLRSKKTERVIFAVTPETKTALEILAKDQCVSVSALITSLIVDDAIKHKDLFEEE